MLVSLHSFSNIPRTVPVDRSTARPAPVFDLFANWMIKHTVKAEAPRVFYSDHGPKATVLAALKNDDLPVPPTPVVYRNRVEERQGEIDQTVMVEIAPNGE